MLYIDKILKLNKSLSNHSVNNSSKGYQTYPEGSEFQARAVVEGIEQKE
jgi:hypothetical protein